MRPRVPVELVGDQCLNQNAKCLSAAAEDGTTSSVARRVQSGNRITGLLGLITVGSLLASTIYFVLKYLCSR